MAITQQTANWLLRNSDFLASLSRELINLTKLHELKSTVISVGALRISGSKDGKVLAVWNTEYLSGAGQEDWGLISLAESTGIQSNLGIVEEVFERSLHVIDLRLQGLLLPEALIHRKLDDNVHRCLAGRGEEGRQFSIGYYENNVELATYRIKAIIISGPFRDLHLLVERVGNSRKILKGLIQRAETIITESVRTPILESKLFANLEGTFLAKTMASEPEPAFEDVPCLERVPEVEQLRSASELTFENWLAPDSPLLETQRRIINSDILLRQPIRIIGAAGSGKTLLMQLLVIKRLVEAKKANTPLTILYIVHNIAMMENVWSRFLGLGASEFMENSINQRLKISTLFELSTDHLGLDSETIIDKDAYETKLFQLYAVKDCLEEVFEDTRFDPCELPFLYQVFKNKDLIDLFASLVSSEIGIAIKGHNLIENKKYYIDSEQKLSRLHGVLTRSEREIIFTVFQKYHKKVFEEMELLDSDDLAISFLGSLKTPLWQMKRKREGFDFVFIDETQLFNENERRIFSMLTKGDKNYVPIALALDESQEINGSTSSGFGRLGIESIADENLYTVYRSTKNILELAFHIIQHTTDLFGTEFPDFTDKTVSIVPEDHKLAVKPRLVTLDQDKTLTKSILKTISSIRKHNCRQIAVVVHAERYWKEIEDGLKSERKDLVILTRRGEKINHDAPITVLARPESVGGQEFDAVIAVGLEQGLVPPTVDDHHGGLLVAFEQKALREMYLCFTRARYQLVIVNNFSSTPSALLRSAIAANLIDIQD